jgi:hypothetical protein
MVLHMGKYYLSMDSYLAENNASSELACKIIMYLSI